MKDAATIVASYIASFNETDAERRRVLLQDLYAEDATYVDPHVEARGIEAIDEFISTTQGRFPGFEFKLATQVDSHHDQARFQWAAGPAGQPDAPFLGFDVIVTEDDKIRNVYGFSDAAAG